MSDYKRAFKQFAIFEIDKEEAWLREMANKGYHFQKINILGIYTFKKGAPEDTIYRIDFKEKIDDIEEYYEFYRQCDFKFINRIRFFNYFKYTGDKESYNSAVLYNDPKEQVNFLKKYLNMVLVVFGLEVAILLTYIFLSFNGLMVNKWIFGLIAAICVLYSVFVPKFVISYNRLKKASEANEAKDYYEYKPYKKVLSALSYFLTPLFTIILVLGTTILIETIPSTKEAMSKTIISENDKSIYPITSIDYLTSTKIDCFNIVLYSNSDRIGVKIFNETLFNRYGHNYTNLSSSITSNNFLDTYILDVDDESYTVIIGKDSIKSIDKLTITYENGEVLVLEPTFNEESSDILFAAKALDKKVVRISVTDKNNMNINDEYIIKF